MANEVAMETRRQRATEIQPAANNALSVFANAESFNTATRMAQALAQSTVVPRAYQGNVGNCLIAIEMASRINTSPMMVMQNLYIVNGNPAWSSQWIIAMINTSHRYKTELQFEIGHDAADGGLSCIAYAYDWNGHKVVGPKVSMTMANAEGWVNKNGSKWKTMPDVMIRYRAASFFGRMNCPDMIMGIYSQEEVIDMGDSYGQSDMDGLPLIVDQDTGEAKVDAPISQEQRQSMYKLAQEYFGKNEGNQLLKKLVNDAGYDSTDGLPTSVFSAVMDTLTRMASEKNDSEQKGNLQPGFHTERK